MFSSLLFGGLSRSSGQGGADGYVSRPSSSPSGAMLSAVVAMHDAEAANSSPILRPSTAADNKPKMNTSGSVASIGSKLTKSPMPDTHSAAADENCAPAAGDTSFDRSTDDVFHTPIIAAGSETSLKFAEGIVSNLSQSVRVKQSGQEKVPLQVRRGHIEPLGVPVPSTYADAANLAAQHPEVADNILSLPLSPKKASDGATTLAEHDHEAGNGISSSASCFHTPSKPNWALAPDKSSPSGKGDRRPRSGKTKEPIKDSELRRRRSRGAGRTHQAPNSADKQTSTKNPSPLVDKGKGKARANGPNRTKQLRRQPDSNDRGSRTGTPSKFDNSMDEHVTLGPEVRSALHLAQVDALIKELQKSRRALEITGSEKNTPTKRKEVSTRASSVVGTTPSPPPAAPPGQCIWAAGHDGVLRPDFGHQGDLSQLSQASPAFVPAGMHSLHSQPMRREGSSETVSAPGGSSRFGTGSRRRLEPRPPRDVDSAFPSAFQGSTRTPEGRGMTSRKAGRGRTPSSQATSRSTQGEGYSWRSTRLSRNPSPAATRGPSPSPAMPSADFGQAQRWPTLDEICDAMKTI